MLHRNQSLYAQHSTGRQQVQLCRHVPATSSRLSCRQAVPSCAAATATPGGTSSRRGSSSQHRPASRSIKARNVATPATVKPLPSVAAAPAASFPPLAPQYNADIAAEEWSRRPVPVVARLLEIAASFGSWWIKSSLRRDPQRAAADMRDVLVELGPAFVKIGQALSSRPDVLPPEYTTELELLQDRIPPFSNEEALQVIEDDLGLPWTEVFSSLSPCPVAAASLGQVYRGRLLSNGEEVAVKVQRPGVVEAIGRDTYILRNLADIARRQAKLNTDLPALVDEWASSLFKELDYTREAANAIRFAELFSFMPEVVVPKMFTDWTTSRVLVMEWIEGERLRSASKQAPAAAAGAAAVAAVTPVAVSGVGSSISSSSAAGVTAATAVRRQLIQQHQSSAEQVAEDLRLVEIGVRCSLEQMLEEGFYHADPHPGNLLKTRDGRLAYIDFGMMGSIEPSVRQALIRATLHLVNREYERLADDFVGLGLLPRGSNMEEVVPALTGVFQTALAGGVSNISFSTLSADLGRTMYKYSFRLPPYYTLLVRSLSVLEGIALASDPNYKVLGAAYPWVSRRLLLTTNSPELTATLDNLLYDSSGRFNFDRLESLLEQAAKARVEAGAAARPATPAAAAAAAAGGGSPARSGAGNVLSVAGALQQQQQQQQEPQGFLANVAAAVGGALAGPEGSELLLSSLQLFSGSNGSNGGGWQQQVSGRGSAAAAAGGPLALVLSPEGRHIRGILEDELAKGLDAAWRLNLDRTLDAASVRLEGAVAVAVATPIGNSLVPQWLREQVRQAGSDSSSSSSSSGGGGGGGSSTVSDSQTSSQLVSNSSSVGGDGRPDLVESLLNLPRLAGEDDRVQVDGLQRLAVQLAAFSQPVGTSSSSSSSGGNGTGHAVAAQQQQRTQQQEANTAALQQVRQAALVLRWFLSELQLLSPDAQREALAIPMRIFSKLGSRVAARAVRTVLTPSPTSRPAVVAASRPISQPAIRSLGTLGSVVPASGVPAVVASSKASSTAAATAAVTADVAAGKMPAGSSSSSGGGSRGGSNGVVVTPVVPPVVAPAVWATPLAEEVSSSSQAGSSSTSSSSSSSSGIQSADMGGVSDGSSSSSSSSSSPGYESSTSANGSSMSSSGSSMHVNGASRAAVDRPTTPLQSDGKGGLRGGRMRLLAEPKSL